MNGLRGVLEKRGEELWVMEKLYPDVRQEFLVKKVLYPGSGGPYYECAGDPKDLQGILVVDTFRLGKMLLMSGGDDNYAVQTEEESEFYYHEAAVHIALMTVAFDPAPRVLVIGGGDGGMLREVLKYPAIEDVYMIEIDSRVVDLCKKYMPSLSQGAFDDPRARGKIIYQDGAVFVKEARKRGEKFDVIIVDSPDPVGPAESLFRTSFYDDVAAILSEGGIAVRQTGSAVYQPDEYATHVHQMKEIFPEVKVFTSSVATYIGGPFTFVAASHKTGIFDVSPEELKTRMERIQGDLRWYTPQMHKAAFALPPDITRRIEESEYGREVLVDLSNCDYEILNSRDDLVRFIRGLCDEIDMKPFGEALAPDFGHAKYRTAGLSIVQLIETSNLSMHVSPHWKKACLNIFTCSSLDAEKAIKFSMRELGANKAEGLLLPRGKRLDRPPAKIDYFVAVRDGAEVKVNWTPYEPRKEN